MLSAISNNDLEGDNPLDGLVITMLQTKTFSEINNQGFVGKTEINDFEISEIMTGFECGAISFDLLSKKKADEHEQA